MLVLHNVSRGKYCMSFVIYLDCGKWGNGVRFLMMLRCFGYLRSYCGLSV